eukprot:COSAG06_NODE_2422_length_6906_cov_3.078336_6_plen_116_part_00
MVPEDDANACELPFEIGTVALTEVLPGLRNHPFLRDRLLISFALAQDNAFVVGPVRKKTLFWIANFILLQNDLFTKTGSGQTEEILRKESCFRRSLCPCPTCGGARPCQWVAPLL